ncbi:molybdenum cofactor guanylyltransferase [Paenibacillus sp. 1P07SE]|uniref:molybdenum cofactor guanylyltransferase n=1 Tax=Paenibacillus sp. 1P07SE TaxID=3132209 RepID=UPI0039A431EE
MMLTGIIVANGHSRRMEGENKSLLQVGGEALIQRQIRLMKCVCSEIIIVTNTPRLFLRKVDESVRILTDYYPNRGPLGGMHAGLTLSRNKHAWIAGWDMPFLSWEAASLMLRHLQPTAEAVLPVIGGTARVLHGIFDRSSAVKMETLLMNDLAMLPALLDVLEWQEMPESEFVRSGIDPGFVTAIKTREDYLETLRLLEGKDVDTYGTRSPAPG